MRSMNRVPGRPRNIRRWMLLALISLALVACVIPLYGVWAANPTDAPLSVGSAPLAWDGTATASGATGESD